MYKYFYKINEPTSGKNENELQITCHRALVRSFARNSSRVSVYVCALLSDCQMPSNRWQRFNLIPVCIEPLLHLTHAHTHTHAQYISTDDFFFLIQFILHLHTTDSHFTPRAFVEKWKYHSGSKKKPKQRLEQNDEKWYEEVGEIIHTPK